MRYTIRHRRINSASAQRILRVPDEEEGAPEPPAWSPLDLPNLYAWYDADDAETVLNGSDLTASASEDIKTWQDKSGNSRHLAQTTAGNRPTLLTGPRRIQFASAGPDFLDYTPGASAAQPTTWFVVAKFDDGDRAMLFTGATGASHAVWREISSLNLFAGTTVTAGTPNTDRHVYTARFNGASSFLRVDTASVITGNPGVQNCGRIRLGQNGAGTDYRLDGSISELIVVAGATSGADIDLCEAYLMGKWGV